MGFSTGAVRELLQDLAEEKGLKGKKDKLVERATEIAKLKQRDTVGPEDVERAVEQIEEEK